MLQNVENRKEILRNKVLVTSVPVNTTQVIFQRTNQINFQKEGKWLSHLVQTSYSHTTQAIPSLNTFLVPKSVKGDDSLNSACYLPKIFALFALLKAL